MSSVWSWQTVLQVAIREARSRFLYSISLADSCKFPILEDGIIRQDLPILTMGTLAVSTLSVEIFLLASRHGAIPQLLCH